MRNDARPLGEGAHDKSPIDERDPVTDVTHDHQSHIVNRGAEDRSERDEELEAEQDRRAYGK